MNLKSFPNKIKDEDYAVEHYTEGWPRNSNEKIGFLYPNSLIPSTKDSLFSNEKKYKYNINSFNVCLVQIKKIINLIFWILWITKKQKKKH